MCDVTLISPSFFTNKSDVLAMIQESTADLLVLPTWADTADTHQALFEYPNPTEIQAVLSKGQRLYCQQLRTNKAPRNLILSRKDMVSLGKEISSDEIAAGPEVFLKRLRKRRSVEIKKHRIVFVFADEISALADIPDVDLQADLLVCPLSTRPNPWTKLSRPLKILSKTASTAMVAHNNGNNPKTLSKTTTSLKLINHGEENKVSVWHGDSKTFSLTIPLAD